jgi:uncharacterized DUF497 family protein
MIFDWDENKEKLNIQNHNGIDFNEASEIFFDTNIWEGFDAEHSTLEEKDLQASAFPVKSSCVFHTQFDLTKTATKLSE